ncbi:MAG TPA: hypothetical protein VEC99_13610 [Clostridia bacterium]|nr:hypothetical protein [Clostridia bacterium]
MNVAGHDPKELWQKFPKRGGGYQAWSQGHQGEVVAMQNGEPVNIGTCKTCGGSTKVDCRTCKAEGKVPCHMCGGKKFVPIAWTPTNNPWLNSQPDVIRLRDGRVLLGKVVVAIGDESTIKLREGKFVREKTADILPKTEETPSDSAK